MILAGSSAAMFAQNDSTNNYVNRFIKIPAFSILAVPDSSLLTNRSLQAHIPTLVMFFSPDCDHCQNQTKELLAYKAALKGIQILLVSTASFGDIKKFCEVYKLSTIPNVRVGQDVNFKFGSIYHLQTYPSIFVYDQNGTLAKAFVGNIGIPAIMDAVK